MVNLSKLENIEIKTNDPELKLFMSDLITFWNQGTFSFSVISTVPTDTPGEAQLRVFDSGAGSYKLYIYFPTSQVWKSANFS